MDNIPFIITWLLGSIAIATAACMLAKHYGVIFLVGMYVGVLIVANAVATKLISVGPFTTNAGLIAFSMTFLLSDCISEFWGKKQAQRIILAAIVVYGMYVFTTQMALRAGSPTFWENQAAFGAIFGSSMRITLAAIVNFAICQLHDVWMYHHLKRLTKNKYLWLRNNVSTFFSHVLDSVVFFGIAFWGNPNLTTIILSSIVLKIFITLADTPFLYFIRYYYTRVGKPFQKPAEAV